MLYLKASYTYEIDTAYILDKSHYEELTDRRFVDDKINHRDFYHVDHCEEFCLMLEKEFNGSRI